MNRWLFISFESPLTIFITIIQYYLRMLDVLYLLEWLQHDSVHFSSDRGMDKRVRPNIAFIRYISQIPEKKHLKDILNVSDKEEIKSVLELILNILEGRIAAKISDLERLLKYKGKLLEICNFQEDISRKKHLLSLNIRPVQLVLIASEYFIHSLS